MRSLLSSKTRARFLPSLETLERRDTPACTVTFSATGVTILGDNANNTIVINDKGDGTVGSISVTCDGVTTANTVVVTAFSLNIDTLNGKDSVTYNLNDDLLTGQTRFLVANLGDKNDTFLARAVDSAAANPDLLSGSSMAITVNGQKGRDSIAFQFEKDFDVNSGASFILNANGNQDRDKISLVNIGDLDGTFTFNFNGNQDNDQINAFVALDTGSAGALNGQTNGQGGNDLLGLQANASDSFTGSLAGVMNGGSGTDAGTASAFVSTSGVENLFKLPF